MKTIRSRFIKRASFYERLGKTMAPVRSTSVTLDINKTKENESKLSLYDIRFFAVKFF